MSGDESPSGLRVRELPWVLRCGLHRAWPMLELASPSGSRSMGARTNATQFRRAIAEVARVARPGAGLFVFTFSRATLAPDEQPIPGEPFVFTQFAGEPQCFLTEAELKEELLRAGFEKDPSGPLTEHNRPVAGRTLTRGGPVIYEGTFRAVRQS